MVDLLPLALLVLGLTIIDATLASMAYTRSRRRYRYAFVALMAMEIVMAWGYILDVNATSISDKLFWNNLEYIGYLGAVPVSFIFAIRFVCSKWMNLRRTVALLAAPFAFWIFLVLNQYHHLFYVDVFLSSNQYISFSANHGPLFYADVVYTFLVISAALGLLVYRYHNTSGQHRKHVGIVTMATMIPLATMIISFTNSTEIPGSFLVIAGLFVSGILLYIGAFGFELFEIVPFAFDRVVGTIADNVFVLDDGDRILFMNHSASSLSGKGTEDAYQCHISEIVPGGKQLSAALSLSEESSFCLELVPGQFFDASVTPIIDPGQRYVGKLLVLQNVTEGKRANDLAKAAEEKTQILNSITRHDISNQLMVIEGNASLAQGRITDEIAKKNLVLIALAARNISNQMAFLRAYQEIGVKVPEWQSIAGQVSRVQLPIAEKGIVLEVMAGKAEVFADPQLEKVFYNLIDNSLTHGVGLSRITISIRKSPEVVELVYEDDGKGIGAERREHLFEMSDDGDHGLGLFLSKKILTITGMTIKEEGEPGKGVRFVISVLPSNVRFVPD